MILTTARAPLPGFFAPVAGPEMPIADALADLSVGFAIIRLERRDQIRKIAEEVLLLGFEALAFLKLKQPDRASFTLSLTKSGVCRSS